jgi:hypothetical protein
VKQFSLDAMGLREQGLSARMAARQRRRLIFTQNTPNATNTSWKFPWKFL